MSNQLFNFNSNPVRVEIFNGQPFFCLLDVCRIFSIQNSRRVQSQMLDQQGVRQAYILANDKKQRKTAFINEPNLYRIIFRSEKEIAKDFQNWVFEEVLPQIRKTGKYQTQPQLPLLDEELPLSLRKKKYSRELTEEQWLRLASMWLALSNCIDLLDRVHKPLTLLGSHLGTTAYTHAKEYKTSLGVMKRILEPMLKEFNVDPDEEAHYYHALKTLREYQPQGLAQIVRI